VQSIREGGDDGKPVALRDAALDASSKAFEELAANVARQVAIRNAQNVAVENKAVDSSN
jgi:hypothetical protein